MWTGFFYNVSNDSNNFRQVAYLAIITDYPTKHSTIYEMLIQTDLLNLGEADLVCDHTVYSKVLGIVLAVRNESMKECINLRMGGICALCVFMAVISKIYGDAGL